MSKTIVSAALFAALATASLSAAAADGKITFTGTISDVTCTVKGGTNTDGGTSNFTVALPTVSTTALAAAGQSAGGGPSQPKCKDGAIASLWFESSTPTVDAANGGRLKNTATSGATNVLVGLLNANGAPINMSNNTNAAASGVKIVDTTATLNYTAQYYATAAATAGAVNTYVNYSVVYN